jgi:hypothetical protein
MQFLGLLWDINLVELTNRRYVLKKKAPSSSKNIQAVTLPISIRKVPVSYPGLTEVSYRTCHSFQANARVVPETGRRLYISFLINANSLLTIHIIRVSDNITASFCELQINI